MKIRRLAGLGFQDPHSAEPLPTETLLGLYPELLRELPVSVVLLRLEDPSDAESFRIVHANRAAGGIIRSPSRMLLGRTLADFPKLLQTPIPGQLLAALRTGEARDLGEIVYSDENIRHGVYSLRPFPLPDTFLALSFEHVTAPTPL